jgi:thiamine-phosphate pyrophosphorylase
MPVPFRLPRFYPVLDTTLLAQRRCSALTAARAMVQAGIRILQYRHKDNWTQSHFDEARQLTDLCQDAGVLFVIDDRADYARLLRTALHVGQDDLPPVAARQVISDEIMGFSTHNAEQLARGEQEPVEYLSLGPIFSTSSKLRPNAVVGVEGLRLLRPLSTKPLVAIGGITLENAGEVFAAKADSVAVISAALPEPCDPKAIARRTEEWLRVAG